MKRPSFQFYPADWFRDTSLRCCSVAARGLWMDMLCYMHEGTPYGHLKVKNKVILPANLAQMSGLTIEETNALLAELSDSGVYSVDENGCIYSRRMVRDEDLRNKRAAGGILGGNPALLNRKVNLQGNLENGGEDKQNPTPSSSSSSSNKNTPLPPKGELAPLAFESPEFAQAWNDWETSRRQARKPITPKARALQMKKLAGMGETRAIAALIHSAENGYTGLFEPRDLPPPPAFGNRFQQKEAPPSRRILNHPEPAGDWQKTMLVVYGEGPIPEWAHLDQLTQETILAAHNAQ